MPFSVAQARKMLVRAKGEVNIRAGLERLLIGGGGSACHLPPSQRRIPPADNRVDNQQIFVHPPSLEVDVVSFAFRFQNYLDSALASALNPRTKPSYCVSHSFICCSHANTCYRILQAREYASASGAHGAGYENTIYEGWPDYRALYTVVPYPRSLHHLVYPQTQVYLTSYPGSTFTAARIEPPRVPEAQRKPYFTGLLLNEANPP